MDVGATDRIQIPRVNLGAGQVEPFDPSVAVRS
jgi:hypothetical protein